MAERLQPVVMEGVRIIFRNFRGEESRYNRPGVRNFGVVLPPEVVEPMAADGWNVKFLDPREEDAEEGAERVPWLPVEAAYDKGRPPVIYLITDRGRTMLHAETVELLDNSDITNVDLIVNPRTWDDDGTTRVKAYLKSMYVTIEEDELEKKYAELDKQ